jgi:hypothetical protein
VQNSGNPAAWTLDGTHTYGYHAQTDYLTSATHGDGLSGHSPTWSYDAAGNRLTGGSVYDDLNRLTETPTYAFTNDILGNRTVRTTKSNQATRPYTWDALNRLLTVNIVHNYQYRADGMRTKKSRSGSGQTSRMVVLRERRIPTRRSPFREGRGFKRVQGMSALGAFVQLRNHLKALPEDGLREPRHRIAVKGCADDRDRSRGHELVVVRLADRERIGSSMRGGLRASGREAASETLGIGVAGDVGNVFDHDQTPCLAWA